MWCDPPPPATRQVWVPLLEPLIAAPGRWALVRRYDRHRPAVDAVRQLRRAAKGSGHIVVPPGRWEFRQGRVESGADGWGVWARYLGEDG